MSNPSSDEVTQADRDAAAAFAKLTARTNLEHLDIAFVKQGRSDDSEIVQAFARHRRATLRSPAGGEVETVARVLCKRNFDKEGGEGVSGSVDDCWRAFKDEAEAIVAALSPSPVQDGGDEAYKIGKRDGYEQAVQDIDLMTGGDGEYVASTFPERDCRDAPAMKARIADRFAAAQDGGEVGALREAWRIANEAPELNMGNFDVEDVEALNAAMIEIWQLLKPFAALAQKETGRSTTETPSSASTPEGEHL